MTAPAATPDPFFDSFLALVAARALITATALGVFDVLDDGASTADTVAARLGADAAGVDALLQALRACGYVEPSGDGGLRPVDAARRLLVSSSPESIATFVGALNRQHWELLATLDDAVLGHARTAWHDRPPQHAQWPAYVRGLHELSRHEHGANAALVPVRAPRRLLDVAGAHGGFAMAMCRRHPDLHATVLDLPASTAVGRQIVAAEGLADRVSFLDGDALRAPLPPDQDVIAMFNFVQHLQPARIEALLRKVRTALTPPGCLVIGETERPEPGAAAPSTGALTGLLFFLMTRTRTYTGRELHAWLARAGFRDVTTHRNGTSPWRVVYIARP